MTNFKPISSTKKKNKAVVTAIILLVLLIIIFLLSLNTGLIKIDPLTVINTFLGNGSEQDELLLLEFRLPRIVIAVLIGMGLAVSGTVLQGVVKNPLADPGIIGINAGAGLAVMIFVIYFSTELGNSVFIMPIVAFIGAGLTAVVIYVFSYKKDEGVSPIRLILVGVAVAAGISALMIVLTLRIDPESYSFVATWLAGSIWGTSWNFVLALLPWLVILIPFVYFKSRVLDVMNLGDATAVSLGMNLERERRWLLAAAVALAAASVSVSGAIGFVGLIAPHMTRRLVGETHKYVIPIAALIGAVLVLTADTLGRLILQPAEIPTGVVVAIIGAPYFLYLLAKLND
ncbi:FecCD family ABC transporter permease [Jeotgalicoccus meleagridis]|uniref:Probable heme-iron transport system permease protein IsdF n=1 Tax=Jeotgalicoccus meleagridis TaxID=2759181 RepID=A0A6V7R1Q5_9STAP|nr:iron ABC transporter permease [Jeotgalicoccus meleagridis]CAD2071281.1 Iron-uptake system permease protein FeuC [Jeotgalicoccus meleagridis]